MAKKRNTLNAISVDEEWLVEDALRCLMRCEEIEKDAKLMAKVRALAKKKMLEVAAIASEGKDES